MTNQHCMFKTEAPSQVNNQDRLFPKEQLQLIDV